MAFLRIAIIFAIHAAWSASDACAVVCQQETVGVDTSSANAEGYVASRCGEAPGQTFVAERTRISSISVFRIAAQMPYGGHLKLWITQVDATGRPLIASVLLDGPVITVPFGDGEHPIEMKFALDPPFELPAPGQYYFAVQDYCGGHWTFLGSDRDTYAEGHAWRSGITCFDGCYLREFMDSFEAIDLVFDIVFCSDVPTPARARSWGALKIMYR